MKIISWLGFLLTLTAAIILAFKFAAIVPTAFGDPSYPTCNWLQGACNHGIVAAGNAYIIGALTCVVVSIFFLATALWRKHT